MGSEKMKCIMARPVRYDIDRHVPVLEKVLSALPNNGHLTTLREYAVDDETLRYKMVARFVPLDYLETIALLQGFIQNEKNGGHTITEDSEDEVEKITAALLLRAASCSADGKIDEAMDIAFAILKVIEPAMENVYDEGYTFQCIMEEAFDFITKMIDEQSSVKKQQHLRNRLLKQHEERTDAERYCDHMWDENCWLNGEDVRSSK
ncbi:hypothetical protein HDC92_002185 [Pedobacter sp. AK017]|uniref:hypothetical protein n=1 Tax=Pedobacter sp. AK017 TaxID=2723073 RepID=UPI00161B2E38|nr:hypothetical protein [Pedobacter sp. AK017]MBB5438509.1 hypothetical protein [Pedobacter sp. AK017]